MKTVNDIPLWVVMGITQPGGHHLARLRPLQETEAKKKTPVRNMLDHYRARVPNGCVATGTSFDGNLNNDEYRLFIGKPYRAAIWSQCRYCRQQFFTIEERRKHSGPHQLPCGKLLQEAYRRLPANLCVVCGNRSMKSYWGLHFCTDGCKNAWKFSEQESYAFKSVVPRVDWRLRDPAL